MPKRRAKKEEFCPPCLPHNVLCDLYFCTGAVLILSSGNDAKHLNTIVAESPTECKTSKSRRENINSRKNSNDIQHGWAGTTLISHSGKAFTLKSKPRIYVWIRNICQEDFY